MTIVNRFGRDCREADPGQYHALSLWQPWASLIALGEKRIETRSWGTPYRGPLLIHATKKSPKDAYELCYEYPFAEALARRGIAWPGALPRGAIVAVADLVTCIRLDDDLTVRDTLLVPFAREYERHFGDYAIGRHAWVLGRVRPVDPPIPTGGGRGLWHFTPQERDRERVRALVAPSGGVDA